jgi:hypothetical protein
VTLQFDKHCVSKGMAPVWFQKFRTNQFIAYMAITILLFGVYYTNLERIQRHNDPNRIKTIKTAMELEDADFIKMVDELKVDYDDVDLRDIERELETKMILQRK